MKNSILTEEQRINLKDYLRELTDSQILFLTPGQIAGLEQKKSNEDYRLGKARREINEEEAAADRLFKRNLERDAKQLKEDRTKKKTNNKILNKNTGNFDNSNYKKVNHIKLNTDRDWDLEEENLNICILNEAIERSF